MRDVGHFVGRDDAVDDRRAVDGEGLGDRGAEFARRCRLKAVAAAGAGERREIRIGKVDALLERGQT